MLCQCTDFRSSWRARNMRVTSGGHQPWLSALRGCNMAAGNSHNSISGYRGLDLQRVYIPIRDFPLDFGQACFVVICCVHELRTLRIDAHWSKEAWTTWLNCCHWEEIHSECSNAIVFGPPLASIRVWEVSQLQMLNAPAVVQWLFQLQVGPLPVRKAHQVLRWLMLRVPWRSGRLECL